MLKELLLHVSNGDEVVICSSQSEITTQQAADLLNVSRPFIVKLIDTGEIPSFKVGKHRRLLVKDVEEYKQKAREKQRKALKELAKIAQKNDMGY